MAFEMLVSRHLYPVFGSGIDVWAVLISMILIALMTGYFWGGILADKYPDTKTLAYFILITAFFIGSSPFLAPNIIEFLESNLNNGSALFCSVIAITFLPICLLGFFTPYSIKLLLIDIKRTGKVSGSIYTISTLGNIAGTLAVPFILIESIGALNSNLLVAFVCFISAISFYTNNN